jgi:hypothetical protein
MNKHYYFSHNGIEYVGERFGYYFVFGKRVFAVDACEDIEPVPSRESLKSLLDATSPFSLSQLEDSGV